MFNIQSFFLRAMLALAIAAGAPSALAGPTYQVSFDTSAWAGTTGYLDLALNGAADATPGFAYVSDLSGDFFAVDPVTSGNASGSVAGGVSLGLSPDWNFFDQLVLFGNTISFSVYLDDLASGNGMLFTAALLNEDFSAYLGAPAELFSVDRVGGLADLVSVADDTLVQVQVVPEPSDWLLVASGLALMAFTRRLQARR